MQIPTQGRILGDLMSNFASRKFVINSHNNQIGNMKKLLISFMALVAVIFVACASDEKKTAEEAHAGIPVLVAFFSA